MIKLIKKVIKIGNSLGITLDKKIVEDNNLKSGDFLEVNIEKIINNRLNNE